MAGLGIGLVALLSAGGCLLLVGVVPLLAVRSEQEFVQDEVDNAIPEPTMVPMTTMSAEPMEEFAPTTTADPGLVNGGLGPTATIGATVTAEGVFGDVEPTLFEVTAVELIDVTEELAAAGWLNAEPVEGVVQVGVPVVIRLVDSPIDPLPVAGAFDWTIVGGATATVYRPAQVGTDQIGCGTIDDDITAIAELSPGGEQRGTACIAIPVADFEHPETRVVVTIGDGESITWRR